MIKSSSRVRKTRKVKRGEDRVRDGFPRVLFSERKRGHLGQRGVRRQWSQCWSCTGMRFTAVLMRVREVAERAGAGAGLKAGRRMLRPGGSCWRTVLGM